MKIITDKDGRMHTEGDHDADGWNERDAKAKLERTRRELRDIISGNVQIHDDPYAKPNDVTKGCQTLAEAKAEVEALIKVEAVKRGYHPDTKVSIHLWWDGDLDKAPKCIGVRVGEIAFSLEGEHGMRGSSYMQAESGCLGAIAAAERSIIERMVCTGGELWAQEIEIEEADSRLVEIMFKKEA